MPRPRDDLAYDLAYALAERARRESLLMVLRMYPRMTICQLDRLLSAGRYAKELAQLTVTELIDPGAYEWSLAIGAGESVEDTIMGVFRKRRALWLTSGFFIRHVGLKRWVAQEALAGLAEAGLLERRGVVASTRYRFVHPGRGRQR